VSVGVAVLGITLVNGSSGVDEIDIPIAFSSFLLFKPLPLTKFGKKRNLAEISNKKAKIKIINVAAIKFLLFEGGNSVLILPSISFLIVSFSATVGQVISGLKSRISSTRFPIIFFREASKSNSLIFSCKVSPGKFS